MKIKSYILVSVFGGFCGLLNAEPVKILKGMVVQKCATNDVAERKLHITRCDFYDPTKRISMDLAIAPTRKYINAEKEENRGIYSDLPIVNFITNARLNKVNLDIMIGNRGVVGVATTKPGELESDGYSAFVNTDVLSEKEQTEFEEGQSK